MRLQRILIVLLFVLILKPESTKDFKLTLPASASIWTESNLPYKINVTYRYENTSSLIDSKQFNYIAR